MDAVFWFIITIAIAALGGYIGYRLQLPAGVMLGAMVITVLFNLTTGRGVFFGDLRIGLQILAGSMIGSRMDQVVVRGMKQLILPIILLVFSMLILNIVFGTAMYLFSPLDAATALFSAAPGGASDMAIIAEDLGAYPPHVAILQLSRLIIIFSVMPFLFRKMASRLDRQNQPASAENLADNGDLTASHSVVEAATATEKPPQELRPTRPPYDRLLLLILSAALMGGIFFWLGVTAGALIGGMVGGTIYCVLTGKVKFPGQLKVVMQVGAGAFIGMRVEHETIASLPELGMPLLIMFLGILAFSFGTGFTIHKLTKLNLMTCLLASTPGGQQEMALLSEDLDADTPSVAIMQTSRLVTVIAFFPTLLGIITRLVNG